LFVTGPAADRPEAGLLALHLDSDAAARQVALEILPRLATLWRRGAGGTPATGARPASSEPPRLDPAVPRPLGRFSGRPLAALAQGRTVLIGWGTDVLQTCLAVAGHPDRSVLALLMADPGARGARAPDRFCAIWPGRMRFPMLGLDGPTPLALALAEGPPIVWSGWEDAWQTRDTVRWCELRPLVRRFLTTIPLNPNTSP
jgi:hypothetical protein